MQRRGVGATARKRKKHRWWKQPNSSAAKGDLRPSFRPQSSQESLSDRRSVGAGSLGKLNVGRRSQSLEMVEGRRREEEEEQVFHSHLRFCPGRMSTLETILMNETVGGEGLNFDQSDI